MVIKKWDWAKAEACLALPNVQEQIVKAASYGAEATRESIIEFVHRRVAAQACITSPIEVIFVAWWEAVKRSYFGVDAPEYGLGLRSQREVIVDGQQYVIDFQVVQADIKGDALRAEAFGFSFPLIGVELDGHEFHEKTKEQVTYRNRRDRDLQRAGWKMFHFSGSELCRDPETCVNEVLLYAAAIERHIQIHYRAALDGDHRSSPPPVGLNEPEM